MQPVATDHTTICNRLHAVAVAVAAVCGIPKTGLSPVVPKKAKKPDRTGLWNTKHTRIFTLYELNFFNRILLATICDNGSSPCPRCYVPRASFGRLGFVSDILSWLSHARNYLQSKIHSARHLIYQCGKAIKRVAIERILKEYSLVPTLVSLAL